MQRQRETGGASLEPTGLGTRLFNMARNLGITNEDIDALEESWDKTPASPINLDDERQPADTL